MSLNNTSMFDLCELLDRANNTQRTTVLFRLHENPIDNVDPVAEALSTFDALDDIEVFQFITEVKNRVDKETWELMSE